MSCAHVVGMYLDTALSLRENSVEWTRHEWSSGMRGTCRAGCMYDLLMCCHWWSPMSMTWCTNAAVIGIEYHWRSWGQECVSIAYCASAIRSYCQNTSRSPFLLLAQMWSHQRSTLILSFLHCLSDKLNEWQGWTWLMKSKSECLIRKALSYKIIT